MNHHRSYYDPPTSVMGRREFWVPPMRSPEGRHTSNGAPFAHEKSLPLIPRAVRRIERFIRSATGR